MIEDLEAWASANGVLLNNIGLSISFTSSSATDKAAGWVDIDSAKRIGRLIIWSTGEAVLSVMDLATDAELTEQRQIETKLGLNDALVALVARVSDTNLKLDEL